LDQTKRLSKRYKRIEFASKVIDRYWKLHNKNEWKILEKSIKKWEVVWTYIKMG
jgi:glutamine synthetase